MRRRRAGARRSRKAPPPMVRWALVSRMTKRSPASGGDRAGRARAGRGPRRRGRSGRRGARRGRRPRPRRGAGGPAATGRPAGPRSPARAGGRRCGRSGACSAGASDHVAAAERVLADAVAGEVEGAAVAGAAALGDLRFWACRPRTRTGEAGGAGDEVVAGGDAAGEHGAGDDGAGARQREAAVDGEAERRAGRLARCARRARGLEAGAQGGSTPAPVAEETATISAPSRPVPISALAISLRAAARRSGSTRSALVSATRPRVRPSRSRIARCSRVCGITPSSAATTSEREVDAAGAGEHVVHQPLVAGDVDEADHAVAGRHVGEAEVDGDAAGLLLLQPVGVDAGQRPHQAGLAVVDVAGGADDHRAGSGSGASAARRARPASSGGQRVLGGAQERIGERAAAGPGAQ